MKVFFILAFLGISFLEVYSAALAKENIKEIKNYSLICNISTTKSYGNGLLIKDNFKNLIITTTDVLGKDTYAQFATIEDSGMAQVIYKDSKSKIVILELLGTTNLNLHYWQDILADEDNYVRLKNKTTNSAYDFQADSHTSFFLLRTAAQPTPSLKSMIFGTPILNSDLKVTGIVSGQDFINSKQIKLAINQVNLISGQ